MEALFTRKKSLALKILSELMKNSKLSDRMLAKKLGVWQSTISRHRKKLEEGIIQEYTLIPDFLKMGFRVFLLHFLKLRADYLASGSLPEFAEYLRKFPQIIFAVRVTGEWDVVIASVHENINRATRMIRMFSVDLEDFMTEDSHTFAALGEWLKPFSLKYLAEVFSVH